MLRYRHDGKNVAWAWGSESSPLVLFVHGWAGRAAQVAPLAEHVSKLGFRCVAIDVTGHGSSPKSYTSWSCFLKDLDSLVRSLRADLYAMVGHSAGGLSMMAARHLKGLRAQRYVCIAAPSHPFPPINVLEKRLNPPSNIVEAYKRYIADQFDSTWDELQRGKAYEHVGSNLLLIYDEKDRFVDHTEGDKILELCPGAQLIKTKSYGHTGVIAAAQTISAVSSFLQEPMLDAMSSCGST
jgi:pimeloyl-ACP methyl ester carboxylesterase